MCHLLLPKLRQFFARKRSFFVHLCILASFWGIHLRYYLFRTRMDQENVLAVRWFVKYSLIVRWFVKYFVIRIP